MSEFVVSPEVAAEIDRRIRQPVPCTLDGYSADGGYRRPIWTPAGFLVRGDRFTVICKACERRKDAPLQQLIDAGKGDWPWVRFTWRCECGRTDARFEVERAAADAPAESRGVIGTGFKG